MTTLTDLAPHRYLAVETVRRNGTPVVTPVWFVVHEGQLYFSAPAHTGKVKRLRHTLGLRQSGSGADEGKGCTN